MNNEINIIGNLGDSPKLLKTKSQKDMAVFQVAQNVNRLNEQTGRYETVHTNWVPVQAYGSLAARVAAGLKKGDRVSVSGEIRTYESPNKDGNLVSRFAVTAREINLSSLLPSANTTESTRGEFDEFAVAEELGN